MSLPINLEELLKRNRIEGGRLEFKESWNQVTIGSIFRTICAFANDYDNLGGGYIIIGVAEEHGVIKRPVKGVDEKQLDLIQRQIYELSRSISPEYVPRLSVESLFGARVVVVWAPSGENRPYRVHQNVASRKAEKGEKRYYIRYANITREPLEEERRELLALKNHVPFDERGNSAIKTEDISMVLLRDHLARVKSRLIESDLHVERLLEAMDLMTGPSECRLIKNVAAMMFCEHPEKFFPCTRAEIVMFPEGRLKNPDNYEERPVITGAVPLIIERVLSYIKTHVIKESIIKVKDRAVSTRYFNYPYQAIEEAVVNAFYHRDYQIPEPVEIVIEPQGITILSHSGPDRSISDQVLAKATQIFSRRYRNRRLGDFLKELGLAEGRATGYPTIQSELAKNGSPKACIETNDERSYFMVSIPCRDNTSQGVRTDDTARSQASLRQFFQKAIELGRYTNPMPSDKDIQLMLRVLQLAVHPTPMPSFLDALVGVSRVTVRRNLISPLLTIGLLEMTMPTMPKSSKQKYVASVSAAILLDARHTP